MVPHKIPGGLLDYDRVAASVTHHERTLNDLAESVHTDPAAKEAFLKAFQSANADYNTVASARNKLDQLIDAHMWTAQLLRQKS